MAKPSDCRKILVALETLLPAMNETETATIAKVIYETADRLGKEGGENG